MSVAAIVLAAGASHRLGQPKQLLEFQGETLLARAARIAAEAGASPVLVVLGAHFEAMQASASAAPAILIFNEQWQQGIATSIHAGIRSINKLAPSAAGALIMACDQPRVTASHLRALVDEFESQAATAITASVYQNTRGIPAVFPRSMFSSLTALTGDKGARALLAHPPCQLFEIQLAGGEIDIDTPSDLAQLT